MLNSTFVLRVNLTWISHRLSVSKSPYCSLRFSILILFILLMPLFLCSAFLYSVRELWHCGESVHRMKKGCCSWFRQSKVIVNQWKDNQLCALSHFESFKLSRLCGHHQAHCIAMRLGCEVLHSKDNNKSMGTQEARSSAQMRQLNIFKWSDNCYCSNR